MIWSIPRWGINYLVHSAEMSFPHLGLFHILLVRGLLLRQNRLEILEMLLSFTSIPTEGKITLELCSAELPSTPICNNKVTYKFELKVALVALHLVEIGFCRLDLNLLLLFNRFQGLNLFSS